ncbi:PepSY-associated TM helix domain-containing protein [Niveispirillum sp. KHB5.9]|uniref:PepSY-associated TM helix domain-containing protein n=1 Tax=Niveispirillum sp. KHB5.9 TaxID=3400269 RepID=UPI003A879E95
MSNPSSGQQKVTPRGWFVRLHRWLGLGAALFWLIQAVTGTLLSFHFELDDALISTDSRPTDMAAVEKRLEALGPGVVWIWTTAGLPDRYVVNYTDADGVARKARIDGGGDVLRDRPSDEYTFFELIRGIHIDLLAGRVGHWIMVVTGLLLVTNLIFGLVVAWPRGGTWRRALTPLKTAHPVARSYSLHKAVGLWVVIPALLLAGTGSLILFEHEIGDLVGAEDIQLPPNPPQGPGVGLAAAVQAGVAAIPGSRFVGTTVPSDADASYYLWVRAPGELYRGGYGGSLVIVNANDAGIRGAWPVTQAPAAKSFVASFYPLHTGEAAGTAGRILALLTGMGLTYVLVYGLLLWWRRTRRATVGPG